MEVAITKPKRLQQNWDTLGSTLAPLESNEASSRSKKLALQFLKYFGVAGIGYVADFGSLLFCKEILHLHYLVSATIGFVIGLTVVYFLSNRYVFGESKLKSKAAEFALFAIIGIVGLIALNLLMWAMTDGFGINYLVSKILATVVVYAWNFLARRKLYHD